MWFASNAPAVIAAVIGLVTYLSPEISAPKRWTVISLTVLTILIVVFNGWSESHQKNTAQQANKEAISAISGLIDQAQAIQQTFLDKNDADLIKKQYEEWFAAANKTLTEKLDASYATSFRSAPSVMQMPVAHSMVGGGYWSAIEGKNILLNNILTDLRNAK